METPQKNKAVIIISKNKLYKNSDLTIYSSFNDEGRTLITNLLAIQGISCKTITLYDHIGAIPSNCLYLIKKLYPGVIIFSDSDEVTKYYYKFMNIFQ